MLSRAQNTFHHNPRLRGPVSSYDIKLIKHHKRVGYSMDIMRQSTCLFINPTTVEGYGFLFNCTTVSALILA